MDLSTQITEAYPELADNNYAAFSDGRIRLQDDADGLGAYIAKWEYAKPIPDGLKLGK
jgi:hypothetical protein